MNNFSFMPVEIFMDGRLSKTDLRVLGAILSWRDKNTNLCHPSREQISERCSLPICKISTSTTRLVELGWLEKSGNGGRSTRCIYKFKVPDLKTVTDSVTVTDLVTVTDSVTKTVTDSVRGNKQKEYKKNIKEKIYKKENSDFEEFWVAYPKKTAKQEALKIWKRKKPPIDEVLKALSWQTKSQQWLDGFIPNPATYLNQGRWEDEQCNTRSPPPVRTKQEQIAINARSIFKNNQVDNCHERTIEGTAEFIEH